MYPSNMQCIFNNDLTQFMCRVFLKYIKTEQVEKRLSWKDALRLGASSLEHPGGGAIPLGELARSLRCPATTSYELMENGEMAVS